MKNVSKAGAVLVLILFVYFSGCKSNGTGSSSSSTTSTSTASSVTLSGTLASSSAGKELRAKDFTGYYLIAQAKGTNKIYPGKVNADGTFSLDVPQNGSYVVTVMSSSSRPAGVFIMADGDSTLTTGLKSGTTNASLGTFTLDETKGKATALQTISNYADTTITARASNGAPVGMGNVGKGTQAKLTSGSVDTSIPDVDKDGLIDPLDADADGNGVVDEFQATGPAKFSSYATTKAGKSSSCITSVGVFMNLKIPYDKSSSFDTKTDMVLTLELIPDSSCASAIETIDLDTSSGGTGSGGPVYKNLATISPFANGWTDLASPTAYPSTGTLWKDANWSLYKATSSEGDTRWTVWVVPNDTVVAGDSFMFKVKYTSGSGITPSTEHFVKAVDYVFTNIPKMATYNGTPAPTPSSGGSGTNSNPITFTGDDLTLTWSRPQDESSSSICGMSYIFTVFYYVGTSQAQEKRCTTTVSDDSSCSTTMSATLTKSDCLASTTSSGSSVTQYQVDVTASSTAGDNSAQLVYFKR